MAWEDIDFKTGTVKVCRARVNGSYKQTKIKRSTREVELIDPAIQWLQVQRSFTERLGTRRLIVMSPDHKKANGSLQMRQGWRSLCRSNWEFLNVWSQNGPMEAENRF